LLKITKKNFRAARAAAACVKGEEEEEEEEEWAELKHKS
jgi:hypothetical protein